MKKIFISIILLLFSLVMVHGQEILTGLPSNPKLTNAKNQEKANAFKSSKLIIPSPVPLPFFDDFKQDGYYPDTARWMDNYVYINTQFSIFPPTWGVATFDAINQYGNIYPDANPLQFPADKLTSRPIRLDSIFEPVARKLSPADSVYFSFYY
nr:hypothetical protein [Bacteroidota bacterium]